MAHRTRPVDVAVVGGGAIGLAVAWRAVQHGLRVTVLERGEPGGGTSSVAAGMLAPVSEATPVEQPLLGLGLASARAYPAFVAELAGASGSDPGLLECGTLLVARDRDEAEALERELLMRQRLGLAVRRVLPSEARRLEPALAPGLRLALEIPDDHVDRPSPAHRRPDQGCRARRRRRPDRRRGRAGAGDRRSRPWPRPGRWREGRRRTGRAGHRRVVGSAGRPAGSRSSPGPPGQGADPPPTRPLRGRAGHPRAADGWRLPGPSRRRSVRPRRHRRGARVRHDGHGGGRVRSSCATRSSSYPGWTS